MNESSPAHDLDATVQVPPAPPLDTDWRRAWRSLDALLHDSEDTEKAVDFFYAVGRRDFERGFQRFLTSPHADRLLRERPSLAAALSNRDALAGMPRGSVGRAYLAYVERNGFATTGLLEVQRRVEERWIAEGAAPHLDPVRSWFRARRLLVHDFFHVLTDYGTDDVGEATVLAFDLGQTGGRALTVLTLGAGLQVWRELGRAWPAYLLRAWRRGAGAAHLVSLPWEELLPLPLDTMRSLAGVDPVETAHPGGILRARLVDAHPAGAA